MTAATHDPEKTREIHLAREKPFRLGAVEVRPATREVVAPGGRTMLEPRVMQVLVALARAGGEIVERDDLVASCWEGRIVGDDSIFRVISRLRKLAEELGPDGWRLETVTKVGYRLLPAGHQHDAATSPPVSAARSADRRLLLGLGAASAAALASGGLWWRLRRPAISPEAQALYEQARDALRIGLPEANAQAQGFLREAVALEPDFADAWGALAMAYRGALQYTPPQSQGGVFNQADAAARRALALDPENAQAHAVLALMAPSYRNWGPAEALYQRALASSPRNADVQLVYSRMLLEVGRIKAAVAQAEAAVAGDPFAIWNRQMLGLSLWAAGRTDEAEAVVAKALTRWPRHYVFWFLQQDILAYSGRADRALILASDPSTRPLNIPAEEVNGKRSGLHALQLGAPPAEVEAAVAATLNASRRGVGYAENGIGLLSSLGRLDEAFSLARALYFDEGFKVLEQRFSGQPRFDVARRRKTHILFLPSARALRADPRFGTLMRDLGVTAYWTAPGCAPDDPAWAHGQVRSA